MKLVSNLQLAAGVAALAEGILTARGQGITDDLLRTVLADSPVVSPASKARLDPLLSADHPGQFSPSLARKDLRLAIALAKDAEVDVRVGPAVEELLDIVVRSDRGWTDLSAVIEALPPAPAG